MPQTVSNVDKFLWYKKNSTFSFLSIQLQFLQRNPSQTRLSSALFLVKKSYVKCVHPKNSTCEGYQ